ncbi:MAG: DIP1984 family protein [Paracoccus sp. (in: a-proteobacteria)]|nr:DIP1984 family protein [Paracoccus sp. (in: a-proteobacteria)]
MKLAEALVLRADMARRLDQIAARMLRNAKVQEGDSPAEDPAALLDEHDRTAREMQALIARINRTNSHTPLAEGTISDALAARDVLRLRQAARHNLAEKATITQMVGTRSEVRFRPAIDAATIQKQADALARDMRELDARIQETNWLTELAD